MQNVQLLEGALSWCNIKKNNFKICRSIETTPPNEENMC